MNAPTSTAPADPAAPGPERSVPWHLGDPLREQRQLTTSAVVVDRGDRDVLTVTGEDRLPWLHSICSQHVSELGDGDATEALVLSPHGHVEQHWQLAEVDGVVWIDTEPHAAATVLEYLLKMRFLRRVEPVDVSADWAVLTVAGPRAFDVLAAAGLPASEPATAAGLSDGGVARGRSGATGPEVDLIVPRASASDVHAQLRRAGAHPVGGWAYDALRIEARIPRLGFETDHRTIPHEVGWIGVAVHLDKGCYRGQETVARVHNLGRPPRRLVFGYLDGTMEELPPAHTPVELEDRTVGFLGTAVHHAELGPIALAVVKRATPDGAPLTTAGMAMKIERVVDA
jgi:folate-binding protein YgfZ